MEACVANIYLNMQINAGTQGRPHHRSLQWGTYPPRFGKNNFLLAERAENIVFSAPYFKKPGAAVAGTRNADTERASRG